MSLSSLHSTHEYYWTEISHEKISTQTTFNSRPYARYTLRVVNAFIIVYFRSKANCLNVSIFPNQGWKHYSQYF